MRSLDRDEQLEAALESVEGILDSFLEVLVDAADAKVEADTQHSKAFLAAEGTEKAREAQAKIAAERFKLDQFRKEAFREFQREKLKAAQDAVSARQSLLSAEKRTNNAFA